MLYIAIDIHIAPGLNNLFIYYISYICLCILITCYFTGFVRLYSLSRNAEHRLLNALLCYRQSHSHESKHSKEEATIIIQRLGNCCNEIGQFYTAKAKGKISSAVNSQANLF